MKSNFQRMLLVVATLLLANAAKAQYAEMGKDGKWVTPDARVYFGEGMGAIFQTINGRLITCPVVYQDVAYKLDKDGARIGKLALTAYSGFAFSIPKKIKVQQDSEMRAEVSIEIESVENDRLLTKLGNKSAVPITIDGRTDLSSLTFRNVVWHFARKMEFSTEDEHFIVERPGATISFTKSGIVLDGVTKTAIGGANNSDSR